MARRKVVVRISLSTRSDVAGKLVAVATGLPGKQMAKHGDVSDIQDWCDTLEILAKAHNIDFETINEY